MFDTAHRYAATAFILMTYTRVYRHCRCVDFIGQCTQIAGYLQHIFAVTAGRHFASQAFGLFSTLPILLRLVHRVA
jgi:hypothetical protein